MKKKPIVFELNVIKTPKILGPFEIPKCQKCDEEMLFVENITMKKQKFAVFTCFVDKQFYFLKIRAKNSYNTPINKH